MSLVRIQSREMFVSAIPTVMRTAVQKSCERLESSRREKMAIMPATVSTAMNSRGCWRILAQTRTVVMWAMKAVRESMNTRTKMGIMANGSM